MKILIIDDDRTVCASLKLLLSRNGYEVDMIHSPKESEERLDSFRPDVVLLDMNFTIETSGKQGLKQLRTIRQSYPNISVILMTGWATVQLAVEGMKIGAKDFIAKPWNNKDLLHSIQNIGVLYHAEKTEDTQATHTKESHIIGESQIMMDVLQMVDRVAPTNASVLITGESGTGKELIAEAIHQKSKRNQNPFVKVNLGGIPTELFESEMFGHRKGAFTGAQNDRDGRFTKAHTGSIFLDELGELSQPSQVKLLRVLQEKTYEPLGSNETLYSDVRVISATNKDIQTMSIQGSFREDLYYRVNLINIQLPPLRDRNSDIPNLVNYFIRNIAAIYQTDIPIISDDTYHWLSMQEYKGNIRQLKNIIERAFLLHLNKKELNRKDFLPGFQSATSSMKKPAGLNLEKMEIETIRKALNIHDHSISSAARALGITRSSLYRRLEKYGIPHEPKI